MEPGQLIYFLLSQTAPVTALAGTRIFPLRAEQGVPRPFITYQLISDPTDSLPSCPDNEAPRVQVSLFADSYTTMSQMARAVKNALHGYRSGQVTVDYENGTDLYDERALCFHRVQDYTMDFPTGATATASAVGLPPATTGTASDDPDADTALLTASALIVGGRLVARLGGLLLHYDASNPAHLGALAGVALTTGNAGQLVRVRQDGPATVIGWGLTPDVDYFAGPDGTLVRNPTGLVFSHLIGRAVSADRLLYDPQDIFIL